MKKIMMFLAVGFLALGNVLAQDAAPSLEDLKKDFAEKNKAFQTADRAYVAYLRKNMTQESKDARAAQNKANQDFEALKIKMLQADEASAQAANDYVAAKEELAKAKTKENQKALADARKAFEAAWKKSGKDKSDEGKAAIAAVRTANANVSKADTAFRAANADAGKLWNERDAAAKARNAADKLVKAAAKK